LPFFALHLRFAQIQARFFTPAKVPEGRVSENPRKMVSIIFAGRNRPGVQSDG
jgi:hypothetical protein